MMLDFQTARGPHGSQVQRLPTSQYLIEAGLLAICLIGYQHMAGPACRGEPHTLPPDSTVLLNYPCQASPARRLLYLLRNFRMVFWDVLNIREQDAWVAYVVTAQLVRVVSLFVLPPAYFSQVPCIF